MCILLVCPSIFKINEDWGCCLSINLLLCLMQTELYQECFKHTILFVYVCLFACLFVLRCDHSWFIPILGIHRPVLLETHSNSKVHKHIDKNSSSVILLNMFNIDTNMYSVSSQKINLDFS